MSQKVTLRQLPDHLTQFIFVFIGAHPLIDAAESQFLGPLMALDSSPRTLLDELVSSKFDHMSTACRQLPKLGSRNFVSIIDLNPGAVGVRSVLVRLRTRSGLNVDRLGSTEIGVESLIALPKVQRHMHSTGSSPHEAVVEIIRQNAELLEPVDLVIADVALVLGYFAECSFAQELYAVDLGLRRKALVERWSEIHELLGAQQSPAPTIRALRTSREAEALGRLAELCAVDSLALAGAEEADEAAQSERFEEADYVVVVGAAVTDLIFTVDQVPSVGKSSDVASFEKHLGGKGLNQAVAVSRLGIPTRFISAVGDDYEAQAILNFLHKEHVETDLIKAVPFAKTPVTGLIVTKGQGTAALGWKNEQQVRLDQSDFQDESLRQAVLSAKALMLTCEIPVETIRAVLDLLKHTERKPLVILNISPLPEKPQAFYDHLSFVDYIVGSEQEIRDFLPDASPETSLDVLAKQLHLLGVEGVCAIEGFSCRVRTNEWNGDFPGFPTAMRDAPGTRCVFSAALTERLVKSKNSLQPHDWEWVTAAMAATQSVGSVPDAMPTPEKIARILRVSEMRQA